MGDDWAEYMARMAVHLSLATHTGIDYFKGLTIREFFKTAKDISEVIRERNEGRDG